MNFNPPKLSAIFLILLWATSISAQDCLAEGIHFKSQEMIDAFSKDYPGCRSILGSLTIFEDPQHSITDLSGLAQIESIEGALNISGNKQLKNLDGLNNINHLGASFRIANNTLLQNINALGAIENISGDLSIASNPRLSNLKGLGNLEYIKEHLVINDNKSLPSLEGLQHLKRVGRDLLIQQNAFLQSLVGLDNLDSIGAHLVVDGNDNLSSLKGLESLSYIQGNLQVVNNQHLSSITGLSSLRQMGGLLQVFNNPFLKSLEGIDSISGSEIGDLAILFSSTLSVCHVRSICDYLADPDNQAAIRNNANGCGSREEILSSCHRKPINSTPRANGHSLFFPNPTNGFLTVRGPILNNARFATSDMAGRSLLEGAVIDNKIDLNLLASGTYIVEIKNDDEIKRELVIKM